MGCTSCTTCHYSLKLRTQKNEAITVTCVFLFSQDLVEKVMMLRKSIERLRNSEVAVQSPILAEKLTCYAGILAAEGSLATAMSYLPENSDQVRGIEVFQKPIFLVFCSVWVVMNTYVSSGWDHDAERPAVPRSGRGCRRTAASKLLQQRQCVHSQAHSCCSGSCTKSTSNGMN